MLKQESNESGGTRACGTCRSAPCTVYREADSAYLCTTGDARAHAAKRVRVCDSCESAPAAFLCKADAASLCTACDAEIHSANPLARRHQRVPISADSCGSMATNADNNRMMVGEEKEDEDEVGSWFNQGKNNQNNGFLFGVEYLDLVDYSSSNQFEDEYSRYQRSFAGGEDGVVPLQLEESTSHMQQSQQHNFHLGVNYGCCSTEPHYNYISVVPESTSSDTTKETRDQVSVPPTQMAQQLTPADREARVLRYREKKKRRKFEKTIRYASRKAYAEVRPRIKGRFAKRIDMEPDAEQLFATSLMSNTRYGIVPSF